MKLHSITQHRLAFVAIAALLHGCANFSAPSSVPAPSNAPATGATPSPVKPVAKPAPAQTAPQGAAPQARQAQPLPAMPQAQGASAILGSSSSQLSTNPPASKSPEQRIHDAKVIEDSGVVVASPSAANSVDADLYQRIVRGFAMKPLDTPLVADKEKAYIANQAYLQRMFTRGGRYLFHIVEEVEKRGMPMEIALLPFVESAMNPIAKSHAAAVGLWQFIPSTGKAYNLNQNWWVDNRRDVTQSTRAALDYLQKIYDMQGKDWFLALASYNWGEGSVMRAVKRAQSQGKSGEYTSLDMPAETRHYVPKLIGLKNVLLRYKELGIALPELPNRPYFVMLEKTRPIDLKLAAKFAGMSVEEFVNLNPAHNRPVIAASKNNQIALPYERLDGFIQSMADHERADKVFASWQPYTLKSGESLDNVAKRGGVTVAELRKANSLRDGAAILPGTRIIAPQAKVADEQAVESFVAPRVFESVNVPAGYHTVRKGENANGIAAKYGISVASLKTWNGLKSGAKRGMNLIIRQPSAKTILTTETGSRSVVGSRQTATLTKVAIAPREKSVKRGKGSKPSKVASRGSVKKAKRS